MLTMMVSALISLAMLQTPAKPPAVGEKATTFNVRSLDDKEIRLDPLLKNGPVVLVVLRGYPGYQCPLCTRQVGELLQNSAEFAKRKATVVMVYPGPAENLRNYGSEFVAGKDFPKGFRFALDPGYKFTESYGLRWNADNETAYPSTFVIGTDGLVTYAKISKTHGGRAPLSDVLAALDKVAE